MIKPLLVFRIFYLIFFVSVYETSEHIKPKVHQLAVQTLYQSFKFLLMLCMSPVIIGGDVYRNKFQRVIKNYTAVHSDNYAHKVIMK